VILAHAIVGEDRPKTMVFLHGILGSGANWRTFARRLVAEKPTWRAVLVDLRKHGASQDFAPPHSLAACANDLAELERSIGKFDGVIGHSFGGKVALEYLRTRKDLELVWVLDASPSSHRGSTPNPARLDRHGSESTTQIVQMLDTLPERFDTREAFVDYVERRGATRAIAMWLAMNVRPTDSGYVMRVDVKAMRELLDDYFRRDEWPPLEDPTRTTEAHLVVGGKSSAVDEADRARARLCMTVHVLEGAGHWVHVDAPEELFALVARTT
jgi:esterase